MSYVIWLDSKDKSDYIQTTGRITYLSPRYEELPNRDYDKYRYLGIDTYRYVFEIYADEQGASIDSLNVGNTVTAYYYETQYTQEDKVNRYLKYLDSGSKTVYKKGNIIQTVGAVVICMCILLNLITYLLYQNGKIPY